MAELISPAGTRVAVNDELAERMIARGWSREDSGTAKRKQPRQKKSETAE